MPARTRSSVKKRDCRPKESAAAIKLQQESRKTAIPPLPLELLLCIVGMVSENYNLPVEVTPFNEQDAYWGTCQSYLSAPCISLPLICRSLRRAGEKALYMTVRVQGSSMEKLLGTLKARKELGTYVRCIDVEPKDSMARGLTKKPLQGVTKDSLIELCQLCPNLKGLVLSGLDETVAAQLESILAEIDQNSPLTYLSLCDNTSDYLPPADGTSHRFSNLSRLLVGSLALRYDDLLPYFGSQLRRLELNYIVKDWDDLTISADQWKTLFKSTPALTELYLIQFEASNETWRPGENLFINVITILAPQLRVLHLDGGADGKDWAKFPPLSPALEKAIVKCGTLDSLYLRRLKMSAKGYLAGLSVKDLAIVQCYYDWDWERSGGEPHPRHAAPIRREDGRTRGKPSDPPGVETYWVRCFWTSHANRRFMEADFKKEIYDTEWPPKISPWYLSIKHFCECDWRNYDCGCKAVIVEQGKYRKVSRMQWGY